MEVECGWVGLGWGGVQARHSTTVHPSVCVSSAIRAKEWSLSVDSPACMSSTVRDEEEDRMSQAHTCSSDCTTVLSYVMAVSRCCRLDIKPSMLNMDTVQGIVFCDQAAKSSTPIRA